MARRTRYGVVRNGEHCRLFNCMADAEAYAQAMRDELPTLVHDGWISVKSAQLTRIWVEEVRSNVW